MESKGCVGVAVGTQRLAEDEEVEDEALWADDVEENEEIGTEDAAGEDTEETEVEVDELIGTD